MKIAVSAQGDSLESAASPLFGRCPTYVFVDSETMHFEAMSNPAMGQGGGAGIQAAQFVVNEGAQVLLTGNLGPNAFDVLAAAGVSGYLAPAGSVRQVVEAFLAGRLELMTGANAVAHAGMGGGPAGGQHRGMGQSMAEPMPVAARQKPPTDPESDQEQEMEALRETLRGLRRQLAETMEKIERLEHGRTN